jgi:hypothetical protein
VRRTELAGPAAHQLVGEWNVKFWLDRTAYGRASDTAVVEGTLSLEEDTYGRISASEMRDPTHAGVYDLDFSRFGFAARDADEIPAAIARVSYRSTGRADSITIVLSPGTHLFPVIMSGAIDGDAVTGKWTASAYRAGGASGRFAMERRRYQ